MSGWHQVILHMPLVSNVMCTILMSAGTPDASGSSRGEGGDSDSAAGGMDLARALRIVAHHYRSRNALVFCMPCCSPVTQTRVRVPAVPAKHGRVASGERRGACIHAQSRSIAHLLLPPPRMCMDCAFLWIIHAWRGGSPGAQGQGRRRSRPAVQAQTVRRLSHRLGLYCSDVCPLASKHACNAAYQEAALAVPASICGG